MPDVRDDVAPAVTPRCARCDQVTTQPVDSFGVLPGRAQAEHHALCQECWRLLLSAPRAFWDGWGSLETGGG